MSKVIVYQDTVLGRAIVVIPAFDDRSRPIGDTDDLLIERVIAKTIPPNVDYRVIEETDLPMSRVNRDSWHYDHELGSVRES